MCEIALHIEDLRCYVERSNEEDLFSFDSARYTPVYFFSETLEI